MFKIDKEILTGVIKDASLVTLKWSGLVVGVVAAGILALCFIGLFLTKPLVAITLAPVIGFILYAGHLYAHRVTRAKRGR